MPNWRKKLDEFGNISVWRKTSPLFYSSVQGLNKLGAMNKELEELVQTMLIAGKSLEQEEVWLEIE